MASESLIHGGSLMDPVHAAFLEEQIRRMRRESRTRISSPLSLIDRYLGDPEGTAAEVRSGPGTEVEAVLKNVRATLIPLAAPAPRPQTPPEAETHHDRFRRNAQMLTGCASADHAALLTVVSAAYEPGLRSFVAQLQRVPRNTSGKERRRIIRRALRRSVGTFDQDAHGDFRAFAQQYLERMLREDVPRSITSCKREGLWTMLEKTNVRAAGNPKHHAPDRDDFLHMLDGHSELVRGFTASFLLRLPAALQERHESFEAAAFAELGHAIREYNVQECGPFPSFARRQIRERLKKIARRWADKLGLRIELPSPPISPES